MLPVSPASPSSPDPILWPQRKPRGQGPSGSPTLVLENKGHPTANCLQHPPSPLSMLTEKRPTVCSANMAAQMSWARRRPPRELPCPPTLQAQHQSPALQTYYIVTFLRSQSSTGDQVLGVFLHEHGTHNRALLNVPTSCAHKMLRAPICAPQPGFPSYHP